MNCENIYKTGEKKMNNNLTLASANPAVVTEKIDRCCKAMEIYIKTLQRENADYIKNMNEVKENENI